KAQFFVHRATKRGEPLEAHLSRVVELALSKLPTPKLMRWGSGETQFVRPVHGLVMLLGKRLIPGEVLGLSSTSHTTGHRSMSPRQIEIPSADAYLDRMNIEGRVIVDFNQRRNRISEQLHAAASKDDATLVARYDALLEEVTALVEYPVIYQGQFD